MTSPSVCPADAFCHLIWEYVFAVAVVVCSSADSGYIYLSISPPVCSIFFRQYRESFFLYFQLHV